MSAVPKPDQKVKLTDAYLKLRKVSPNVLVAHELALKKGPAFYPIRRVECKSFIVPAENPYFTKDNIFNGLVPKSVVFGLVDSAAFNGSYTKNPFNFKHFNMSSIAVTVNGEDMPFKPLQLSYWNSPKYLEAYTTLFSGTGKMYYDVGNDISREEFANGYAIYAFDLTPDICIYGSRYSVLQCASCCSKSCVLQRIENTIHIDSERNVIYDYSG